MTRERPLLTPEEVWRRYDAIESRLTAPVSERMLDLAGVGPGQHVLDLASGRGEPALRAAHRVGPHGSVLGLEPSDPVLQMAREKATADGLANLELRVAGAEHPPDVPAGRFHAATIRWGLMYVASPLDVLATVRRALRPDGVLVLALWAEPARVPYFTLPRRVLAPFRSVPPVDETVPGTFRYADPARLRHDLDTAGFALEHEEELDVAVMEAETAAELIAWCRVFGLTRLLDDLPEATQAAWEAALAIELERLRVGPVIRLGGVTRLVVARPGAR